MTADGGGALRNPAIVEFLDGLAEIIANSILEDRAKRLTSKPASLESGEKDTSETLPP